MGEPYQNPGWVESQQQILIGIDPGQAGAVGIVYPDDRVQVYRTPVMRTKTRQGTNPKTGEIRYKTSTLYDEPGMVRLLFPFAKLRKEGYRVLAVIEEVHAKQGDGVTGSFKFGFGFGLWRGILAALRLPYTSILPTVWKPPMVGTGADKHKSRLICMRLFPDLDLPLVSDADKAEAVLIAAFYKRREGGLPMLEPKRRSASKPAAVKAPKVPTDIGSKPKGVQLPKRKTSAFFQGLPDA